MSRVPVDKNRVRAALAEAENVCARQGRRLTPLRRRVLTLIWRNRRASKAYELLAKMDGAKPPTVYRTLNFLQEAGLVHKLRRDNTYTGCSHPLRHQSCYFLLCAVCRRPAECCNPRLLAALNDTVRRRRFSAARATVEIEGVCRDCR